MGVLSRFVAALFDTAAPRRQSRPVATRGGQRRPGGPGGHRSSERRSPGPQVAQRPDRRRRETGRPAGRDRRGRRTPGGRRGYRRQPHLRRAAERPRHQRARRVRRHASARRPSSTSCSTNSSPVANASIHWRDARGCATSTCGRWRPWASACASSITAVWSSGTATSIDDMGQLVRHGRWRRGRVLGR